LFALDSFVETLGVAHVFGILFATVKAMHQFWQKMYWDTFWAIFSQTHLVTLISNVISRSLSFFVQKTFEVFNFYGRWIPGASAGGCGNDGHSKIRF
jgi:putative alpha-1,2-mannosidase